ncbi:JmjC domain-containing histone demethylation protein 1 [Puccinia graminis f. sp. tritici]|uniref:JmjC domain-containing histone demethylation protein 1 n=2 Tax=Puccinia graminis f. sp. tritici TaxID=56615 RepID=A0A5B0PNH5_PUCGR|nr:JmjC domain-containing histone demethylation protein 1 [Puccinia graminis f. sp. tritici]
MTAIPTQASSPSTSTNTTVSSQSSSTQKNKPVDRCLKCLLNQPACPTPWIYCSLCSSSWHWSCVTINQLDPIDIIEKWFCGNCTKKDPNLQAIYKEPPRKSSRAKAKKINYSDLSNDPLTDPDRFVKLADTKKNVIDGFDVPSTGPHKAFRKMKPEELSLEWLVNDPQAMTEPIVIDDSAGLRAQGMRMPSPELTISQIAELVGPETPVEVIDVASQAELSRWTLAQWASYYEHPARQRVRNVISLEVSDSPLGDSVQLPQIVKDLDWVNTIWPSHLRAQGSATFPKVQKYCLMSVARCWTDWHIDFAGSSVFYHILRGAKTFYFIRPTVANLAKYERWSGSSKLQESTWLGDQVNVVYKVCLRAGQTMMIPTGWIHAVHTPVDSLVFGGNFLHSLNIPLQLRIHQIENNTKVPKKFRFPFFLPMLWFVACHYLRRLEGDEHQKPSDGAHDSSSSSIPFNLDSLPRIPERILAGLSTLAEFLPSQTEWSDNHPPLSSAELSKVLEGYLDTNRIPNLGQTSTQFQHLLRRLHPSTHPSPTKVEQEYSTNRAPDTLAPPQKENNPGGESGADKKPFKSPLQITLKRKISCPSVTGTSEEGQAKPPTLSSNRSLTLKLKNKNGSSQNGDAGGKTTTRGETKKKATGNKKVKSQQTGTVVSQSESRKKTDPGEILRISNPPPVNHVHREKRARPFPLVSDQSDGLLPPPPADSSGSSELLEDVEVRTTSAENSVLRKSVDPRSGMVIFETRTVKTVIEKAFFPPV